jgi:hypothetical protein
MNWIITIYSALLFFVLSPGVLLRLPAKSGKFVVAATHAVVFALVWHFTSKIVWRMSSGREGFQEGLSKQKLASKTDAEIAASPQACGSGEASSCGTGCYSKDNTAYLCKKGDGAPTGPNDGFWKKK